MNRNAVIIAAVVIVAVHALILFLALHPGKTAETADLETSAASQSEAAADGNAVRQPEAAPTDGNAVRQPAPPPPTPPSGISVPEKPVPPNGKVSVPPKPVSTGKSGAVKPQKPDIPSRPFAAASPGGPLNWQGVATGNLKGVPPLTGITKEKSTGILVDLDSRKVLWHKESDRPVAIASMTKIMTLMLAYEMIREKGSAFTPDSEIPVTKEARAVPPSGVAFQANEKSFPLKKLMVAAAVKSANDASFLIAQALGGGSADRFVERMNARARELGMTSARFFNPHGLNGKTGKFDNRCSVRDMVRLCEAFLTYPELGKLTSLRFASFRTPNDLVNHNLLLPGARTQCKGVCGIKTGFTQRAGYCVAALCIRDGRRLLAVVTGFSTQRERDEFTRALLEWGFKNR